MKKRFHRDVQPPAFADYAVRRRFRPGVRSPHGAVLRWACSASKRVKGGLSPREVAMAIAWAGIGFFADVLLMHCLVTALRSDIIADD